MRGAVLLTLSALVLASCATTQIAPTEAVRGCWIERRETGETVTLRFLPEPDNPAVLRGDMLTYPANPAEGAAPESRAFRLGPAADDRANPGWALCDVTNARHQVCWAIARGAYGSLEGGRIFIEPHKETLRILHVRESGASERIFNGARDGCD